MTAPRCAAAHRDDPTPCEGPQDAVEIRSRFMSRARDADTVGVLGCVRHGAHMLASLDGGRVYPGPGDTAGHAAIDTYKQAQTTPPFAWTDPSEYEALRRAALLADGRCPNCEWKSYQCNCADNPDA